jgi:hypothetical protein
MVIPSSDAEIMEAFAGPILLNRQKMSQYQELLKSRVKGFFFKNIESQKR